MIRTFKSLPSQVLADEILKSIPNSYDRDTDTSAYELYCGILVRIHCEGHEVSPNDFFIFEEGHPMGGYHCPRHVFDNRYQAVGQCNV